MPIRDTSLVVIRRLLLLPGQLHVIPRLSILGGLNEGIRSRDDSWRNQAILLKTATGSESSVRVVCVSLAGAAPELPLFFNACKAQLLDC